MGLLDHIYYFMDIDIKYLGFECLGLKCMVVINIVFGYT